MPFPIIAAIGLGISAIGTSASIYQNRRAVSKAENEAKRIEEQNRAIAEKIRKEQRLKARLANEPPANFAGGSPLMIAGIGGIIIVVLLFTFKK
jgi:hypothetical protein